MVTPIASLLLVARVDLFFDANNFCVGWANRETRSCAIHHPDKVGLRFGSRLSSPTCAKMSFYILGCSRRSFCQQQFAYRFDIDEAGSRDLWFCFDRGMRFIVGRVRSSGSCAEIAT